MFRKVLVGTGAAAFWAIIFAILIALNRGERGDLLNSVQKKGVLVVATSADYPPFEYQDLKNGKDTTSGSDVELAKIIAKKLGVRLEIQNMSFNTVLLSVSTGKADLGISAISATPERQQSFDFTDVYYTPTNKLLIKKSNFAKFKQKSDLSGTKIGAQKGSIQESVVQDQIPDAKEIGLSSIPDLANEVKIGSMSGVMIEGIIGENYISNDPDLTFADLPITSDASQSYSIAVPKGNPAMKQRINQIIRELKSDSTIDALIVKNSKEAGKNE